MKSNLPENLLMFDSLNFNFFLHNTKLVKVFKPERNKLLLFIGEKEGRDPFVLALVKKGWKLFNFSTF
jgi:hypothetical protein